MLTRSLRRRERYRLLPALRAVPLGQNPSRKTHARRRGAQAFDNAEDFEASALSTNSGTVISSNT